MPSTYMPNEERVGTYVPLVSKYQGKIKRDVEASFTLNSLIQYALGLCMKSNPSAAQSVLKSALEIDTIHKICMKSAKYWILRAEIAENLGQFEIAASYFEIGGKSRAQPFLDLIVAFKAFVVRNPISSKADSFRQHENSDYMPELLFYLGVEAHETPTTTAPTTVSPPRMVTSTALEHARQPPPPSIPPEIVTTGIATTGSSVGRAFRRSATSSFVSRRSSQSPLINEMENFHKLQNRIAKNKNKRIWIQSAAHTVHHRNSNHYPQPFLSHGSHAVSQFRNVPTFIQPHNSTPIAAAAAATTHCPTRRRSSW